MLIRECLSDNSLVAINKQSESIPETISFLLFSTPDQSYNLIDKACQQLRLMIGNNSVPPQVQENLNQLDSLDDFFLMPSQPCYSDMILHLLGAYLKRKIEVYEVQGNILTSLIFSASTKLGSKLRILRQNNYYYPLWKQSYFQAYQTCQLIIQSITIFDLDLVFPQLAAVEGFDQDSVRQTRKNMHKKSLSDKGQKSAQKQKQQFLLDQDDEDADFLIAQCSKVIDQQEDESATTETQCLQSYYRQRIRLLPISESSISSGYEMMQIPNLLRHQSSPAPQGYQDQSSKDDNKLLQSLSPQKTSCLTGRLKFFDEQKNYGFFILDLDQSDIFVHYDDLQKAGLTKEMLKAAKYGNILRFQFSCMNYYGKYHKSRKAVDVELLFNLQDLQ